MNIRIKRFRRYHFHLSENIKTKYQLFTVRKMIYPIFDRMKLSPKKIREIKIRFGKDKEFEKNSSAFYDISNNIIVLKRCGKVIVTMTDIAHEVGHIITKFCKFGIFGKRRRNILGETSAYNFEIQFINTFNKSYKVKIHFLNGNFLECIWSSPVHYISRVLKFVPLGKWIKKEYLA